jgi:nitrous oxide reductase
MFFRRKKKATGATKGATKGKAAGGAGAKTAASKATQGQTRAEAEAQVMRMMTDGSLDKYKALMNARRPGDIAEEYPTESVSAIRTWLAKDDS